MSRRCDRCDKWCYRDEFSSNQWAKGEGSSKCTDCVSEIQREVQCNICRDWFQGENSLAQHMKTHPSCSICDRLFHGKQDLAEHMYDAHPTCPECHRGFRTAHDLFQHSKVHLPRTVSCPICGVKQFKNAANAVAHVESGYCSGCLGQDNARTQIFEYVSRHAPSLRVPMIENGYSAYGVPDMPYRCTFCTKQFAHLSAQMNHEGDAHRNNRHLGQLGW